MAELGEDGYVKLMQKHYRVMKRELSIRELMDWLAPYASKIKGKWTVDYELYLLSSD